MRPIFIARWVRHSRGSPSPIFFPTFLGSFLLGHSRLPPRSRENRPGGEVHGLGLKPKHAFPNVDILTARPEGHRVLSSPGSLAVGYGVSIRLPLTRSYRSVFCLGGPNGAPRIETRRARLCRADASFNLHARRCARDAAVETGTIVSRVVLHAVTWFVFAATTARVRAQGNELLLPAV